MNNRIRIARGTKNNLQNDNLTVPADGTPIYNTTEKKLYVGDGTKTVKQLYDDGGIITKTSEYAWTADKAVVAQYASDDTSKGTIEERLTRLGFRSGSVSLAQGITASTNTLSREGNYVKGTLTIPSLSLAEIADNQTTKLVLGIIPEEFRPESTMSTPTYPATCTLIKTKISSSTDWNLYQFPKAFKVGISQTGELFLSFAYTNQVTPILVTSLYSFEKQSTEYSNSYGLYLPGSAYDYIHNNTAVMEDFSLTLAYEAAPIV